MKDGNTKKLVFVVIALVVVVLLLFLGIKAIGNKKGKEITGEEKEKIETVAVNYISNLTAGSSTVFGGSDVLFATADKQTYKDLEPVYVLTTAYNYVIDSGKASVDSAFYDYVKRTYHYSEFSLVKGEEIRKAVKEIFGEDFKDTDASMFNFIYKFEYNEDNDLYIITNTGVNVSNDSYTVYTKAMSSVAKGDKVEVDLVVAYVFKSGDTYSFTKDSGLKEAVFTSDKYEMNDDKADSFDHFIITLNKDGDKYTFESIQKK